MPDRNIIQENSSQNGSSNIHTTSSIPKRVLIIGGYGNFGSYIAKQLAENPNIQLIIAGRSSTKAQTLCLTLNAVNSAIPFKMDITQNLMGSFKEISPDIVVHTSGPFQGQDAFVAKTCIKYGCHYIDLADGRDFVCNIINFDALAKEKRVLIISGASSVPCLSSCLLDHYSSKFNQLTHVEYGISTAQHTNRGLATTQAVLSYAGHPFSTLINNKQTKIYGWQGLKKHRFKKLGNRLLGNCDIPDLSLFPALYPSLKTIRFYAGLEISFIHIGLWLMTWLRRIRLLPSLDKLAPILLKLSRLFDHFGSDNSGFYMQMLGTDSSGRSKTITFNLTAEKGDGPYIPCMPAIILATKLADNDITHTGATPCVSLIKLDEYLSALKCLNIVWSEEIESS